MRNDDVPGLIRKFLPPVRRRAIAARGATLACALLAASPAATLAQGSATFPVGIRELDYVDPHEDGRHLTLRVFYPAAMRERSATPFVLPFFTKLNLYKDAEAADGEKRPLVVFSHGRGSNGLYYAWFAEFLASHGYIVAALNHYRANTYDSTIAYLANKLWQRPRDVALSISFLLFINECDDDGRNEFPQACIDAPGVDRGKIHAAIADAALKFFDASLNAPRGK
jgi:predicted dienelactone hydrolase